MPRRLPGVKIGHDVQEDLTGLGTKTDEAIQKIYPEGTQIGDASRSQSGLARVMARQAFAKSLVINSEVKPYGPEQTGVIPSRSGGNIVATGSPAMAGRTEAAKTPPLVARAAETAAAENPALIARAGGQAAAKAPYEAGGDITVPGGPSGLQSIPATAATRAAMQPGAAPPAPAIPSPPADATAPIVPKAVKTVPAIPSVNERFGPFNGVGGKPVETPEYHGRVELEKGAAEDFNKKSVPSYEAAQNLMGRLTVMDHNIDALGPKWMGAGANARASSARRGTACSIVRA